MQRCLDDGDFDAALDYFPNKFTPREGSDWDITYRNFFKVVKNTSLEETYVLTQCGAPRPTPSQLGPDVNADTAKFFEVPLENVYVSQTVEATFLEQLGVRTKISYIDTSTTTSECINYLGFNGLLDGTAEGSAAVLSSGASTSPKSLAASLTSAPTAIERAGWIGFFAALFNKEREATDIYSDTIDRFNCHRDTALYRAERHGTKSVAWVSFQPTSPTSPATWSLETPAYKAELVRSAGGMLLEGSRGETRFDNPGDLKEAIKSAEIVIDDTYKGAEKMTRASFLEDFQITPQELQEFPFLVNDQLWATDKFRNFNAMGYDWFESALPEPDVVLEDLISIIHPGTQEHDRVWLRHQAEPLQLAPAPDNSKCRDPGAALPSRADECPIVQCIAEDEYDPERDYFPVKVADDPNHAELWSVRYPSNNYKEVTNQLTGELYVLTMCGTPAPDVPAGRHFTVPLQKVAVSETVSATFMERLGVRRAAHRMDVQYVNSPCLTELARRGELMGLSPPGSPERAEELRECDGNFAGPLDGDPEDNLIVFSVTSDPGPLHRAEWLTFTSLFFNAEKTAVKEFQGVVERYACHTEQARLAPESPLVAWVRHDTFVAPERWEVSVTDYTGNLTLDAGARVLPAQSYKVLEDFQRALRDADVVIDETYYVPTSIVGLGKFYESFGFSDDDRGDFKFLRGEQVWRSDKLQNGNGGWDWFESAIPEPDVVLQDLMTFLAPSASSSRHTTTWFRNMALAEEVVISDNLTCPSLYAPLDPRSEGCDYPPQPISGGGGSSGVAVAVTLSILALLALFAGYWWLGKRRGLTW